MLAQQPSYRPESSQKVQLEDIEQDNLKSVQQSTSQVQSSPQYTAQYQSQNSPLVYPVPTQQSQHVVPAQASAPQTATYPLFAVPTQTGAGLPGQQHYIYYMQTPQQLAYDVPFFGAGYPFVPQTAQSVLPQNVNVNELYKTLQPQVQSASGKSTPNVKTAAAAPQLPPNYYFSTLPQTYYSPVHIPQVPVSNSPQYVAYNSFYPVQAAQKSVYSSGVKSTTAAPVKQQQTESSYRFEYNSPDFAKLRVSG